MSYLSVALLVLVVAVAPLNAQSGRWQRIATSADGSTWTIDTESLRGAHGVVTFWRRAHFDSPQSDTTGAIIRPYSDLTLRAEGDCQALTIRVLAGSRRDTVGTIVWQNSIPGPVQGVEPGTVDEASLLVACRLARRRT